MSSQPELDQFISAVTDLSHLWRSIDIRVLAIRIKNEWHNLATSCLLDARQKREVPRYENLPRLDFIGAWQNVLDLDDLGKVLENVARGTLEFDSESVLYLTGQGDEDVSPYRSWNYSFSGLAERQHGEYPPWAKHNLLAAGDQGLMLLGQLPVRTSELDRAIRALEHPFDGLGGLATMFVGDAGVIRSGHSATFRAVAPIPARLDEAGCRLEGGELSYAVTVELEAVERYCSLGFVAPTETEGVVSDSIHLSSEGWSTRQGASRHEGRHVIGGVQSLTLLLRVGDWPVDKATLIDPAAYRMNPIALAYSVFDPDLEVLQTSLKPESQAGSRGFEKAVARMFVLLGFHVDFLSGDRRLGDAVDLVAFALNVPVAMAVECTTGSIDAGGKLGKLVGRAKKLEAALVDVEIIPVLVTSLGRQALSDSELQNAAADRISVLAEEDVDELQLLLTKRRPLLHAVQFIRSKIGQSNGPFSTRTLG